MAESTDQEQFVRHITEHQNRLFAYVFSLLGDHTRAADVLQETNMVLWRKHEEFRPGAAFLPWAFTIARFQVMANTRDAGRDRSVLNTELVELLSVEVEVQAGQFEDRRIALRHCLQTLNDDQRQLVESRYFGAKSIRDLSESLNRGASAVKVALLRARRHLADCIEQQLASEGSR
ncbi:sigma-70 family RNA polymerase sigma factor [bacterium]|nr:sigma-70 family RNA polymerase sigma factor [bacterium]